MTNRKYWLGILALVLIFGFTNTAIHAQSTNHVPRLAGTWICAGTGDTVVLNANGTGAWGSGGNDRFRNWGAIGDKIVITYVDGNNFTYDFILSSDGRTLLLSSMRSGTHRGWILQRRD